MPTPSPKLGLSVPTTADRFETSDLADNWNKLDTSPGIHICTSTTRPTWGAAQVGRTIQETNTNLQWMWTGTSWVRITGGSGILKLSNGGKAVGERTTDFSSGSQTFIRVIQLPGVVVPDGRRTLMFTALWQRANNGNQGFVASVFRSNTPDSGPQISRFYMTGDGNSGASLVCFEKEGLAPGTYDFSLQVRALTAGAITITGDGTQPIQLSVAEL